MSELWSFLAVTGILFIIYLQIDSHNEIVSEKFRFKFFELRDRLALQVCKGELKEDSWEYTYIIDALNYHICAVDKVSISEVVEAIIKFHTSKEEGEAVKRFQRESLSSPVKQILDEYMLTAYRLIKRNSRSQIFTVKILMKIAEAFKYTPPPQARTAIVNPKPALSAIENHRSALQSNIFPIAA